MTFSDNVKAITNDTLAPKAVDTISDGAVLPMLFLNNTDEWSGTQQKFGVIVSQAGNGKSFSGLDKFNTNLPSTKKFLTFDPRGYEQPVVLSQMEVDANASAGGDGDKQAAKAVGVAMEEAANEASETLGTMFYSDGTGNSSKDFLGLAAIVDDGGEVATYGGLSRSTYTTLKANETDLGGALTFAAMASMYDLCTVQNDEPSVIITTKTIWSAFEALHQSMISHNTSGTSNAQKVNYSYLSRAGFVDSKEALKGDKGFKALAYRGTPVISDEKCTSGTMWFLNLDWIKFYILKSAHPNYKNIPVGGNKEIKGVYGDMGEEAIGFQWSGLHDPIDQYGRVGHILLMGNLLSANPNRHGVINTIS